MEKYIQRERSSSAGYVLGRNIMMAVLLLFVALACFIGVKEPHPVVTTIGVILVIIPIILIVLAIVCKVNEKKDNSLPEIAIENFKRKIVIHNEKDEEIKWADIVCVKGKRYLRPFYGFMPYISKTGSLIIITKERKYVVKSVYDVKKHQKDYMENINNLKEEQ